MIYDLFLHENGLTSRQLALKLILIMPIKEYQICRQYNDVILPHQKEPANIMCFVNRLTEFGKVLIEEYLFVIKR